MRTIDSYTSVKEPSNLAWWHSSWTGRFILAALLIAAAAMVFVPDRASAHHATGVSLEAHCKANGTAGPNNTTIPADDVDVDNGRIDDGVFGKGLQADCIALLTAAQSLRDVGPAGVGTINWILTGNAGAEVDAFNAATMTATGWNGVIVTDVDEAADNDVFRVTSVVLENGTLTGTLTRHWADLDELVTLNISGHSFTDDVTDDDDGDISHKGLTGSIPAAWGAKNDDGEFTGFPKLTSLKLSGNDLTEIPRSVWELFEERLPADTDTTTPNVITTGLMLDGNLKLEPSPALGLNAVVAKDASKTQIEVTFNTVWYTTEVKTHEYRYRVGDGDWLPMDDEDNSVWMDAETGCQNDADPPVDIFCAKTDPDSETPVMNSIMIEGLDANDSYTFEVRSLKTILVDENDPATPTDATDDTAYEEMTKSTLNIVGPQTLTAESPYSLMVAVGYSSAMSADVMVLEHPMVETDDSNADDIMHSLSFNPLAEGMTTVDLTQTGGMHTFPVDVLSADDAPDVTRVIPNRELVDRRGVTRTNLTRYFSGDNLEFKIVSNSRPQFAMAEIKGDYLEITTRRVGHTDITIRATDLDTRGFVDDTFRVTVILPNNAPRLAQAIPDLTLYLDDAGTQVDMRPYFRDEDQDFLLFIPQSANPRVVTGRPMGPNVIFNVVGLGEARMTIIAQDGKGGEAVGSFTITVLDPNFAPETVGEMPAQTIRVEGEPISLDVSRYFTDPNNDDLTYTAASSDTDSLTVEIEGSMVTLTAVAPGEVTVTVRATDPGGKSATQEMAVTVLPPNNAPVAAATFADHVLQIDDNPLGIDVTAYFSDPDGDEMRFTATSSEEAVATVSIRDGMLTVVPVGAGETIITVTAIDVVGAAYSMTFMVTVQANVAPEAVGSIDDQVMIEGGRALEIMMSEYFSDANGDELTYTAETSNSQAVGAIIIDGSDLLVLRPLGAAEEVTVTVTATDPDGESATQIVIVTVIAAEPEPTATPEATATPIPEPTPVPATPTPAPTPTPEPDEGGFPIAVIIIILLLLAGAAAAVFIIQRRR